MSVSQILSGGGSFPAYVGGPFWSARLTLAAGGVGSIVTATLPFAVSQQTLALATPLGAAPLAPVFVTRAFGAAGAGTVSVNTADAGDAAKEVFLMVWNGPDYA
jgi:hypothetical protein